MTKCCIAGCDRIDIKGRGMCGLHYGRWHRHGDPHIVKKIYRHKSQICSVDGCENPTLAKGLCGNHYALMRRNGEPIKTKIFKGEYIKDGYKYVYTSKRHYEPEHRVVMERFLQRKLKPNEQIHHIDGNKLNNSPSNLRIVTRSEHMSIHRRNGDVKSKGEI